MIWTFSLILHWSSINLVIDLWPQNVDPDIVVYIDPSFTMSWPLDLELTNYDLELEDFDLGLTSILPQARPVDLDFDLYLVLAFALILTLFLNLTLIWPLSTKCNNKFNLHCHNIVDFNLKALPFFLTLTLTGLNLG